VTVVLWASAFVAVRSVGHHYSAGALLLGRQPVGSLALTVIVLIASRRGRSFHVAVPRWVPAATAFLTWAYALARTPAGRLAVATYVVPPMVVVLSWALLDEVPRPLAFVGGALCLTGVAIATLTRRRRGAIAQPTPVSSATGAPVDGGGSA
jgi:drug/metabolite transporter (DMT)-like permease